MISSSSSQVDHDSVEIRRRVEFANAGACCLALDNLTCQDVLPREQIGVTRYVAEVEIADSARTHGIADEDMRHATRVPFRLVAQGNDRVLVIGPDRNGNLLDVVVSTRTATPRSSTPTSCDRSSMPI